MAKEPQDNLSDGGIDQPETPTPSDERVAELMAHTIDVPALAAAVELQEAADAADTLEALEDDEIVELLESMKDQSAADALAEMEGPLAIGVLEDLLDDDAKYAGHLLELMAPDDAADLLQDVDDEERVRLLAEMPAEAANRLRALVGYDKNSAGGLMTTDFVAVTDSMTVHAATETLRASTLPDWMQHLFVVDAAGRLQGVASLRTLLLAQPDARIGELMHTQIRAVGAEVNRETVARDFDRYDYYMLAVVDDEQRLLGVVTVDDVIDIIRSEHTEDVQKSVGAGAGEAVYSSIGVKIRGRFPWLGASLGGMCGSASVILVAEDLVTKLPILAFLMPVIAAVVGNAGQQSLMVTLRGIVLDEVRPGRVAPLLLREAAVGLLNGAVLGIFICVGVGLLSTWFESASWSVGAVAGAAMLVSMGAATLVGCGVPLIMRRLGIDPALAASIILIMITDAVAFATILALSVLALARLTN